MIGVVEQRKTLRKHEDLLMYSKGKKFMFNKDDVRIPYILKKSVRKGKELNPLGKIPTDVLRKRIIIPHQRIWRWMNQLRNHLSY